MGDGSKLKGLPKIQKEGKKMKRVTVLFGIVSLMFIIISCTNNGNEFSGSGNGNEFFGEWIVADINNPYLKALSISSISIVKNGDYFIFTQSPPVGHDEPASFSNGIMRLPTKHGNEGYAFIDKRSGQLHLYNGSDENSDAVYIIFNKKGGVNK